MHCAKLLTYPVDTVYLYDGSPAGFYCCMHESVYEKEMPLAVHRQDASQRTMLPTKTIHTNEEKAQRVRTAVSEKISLRIQQLVDTVFFSCLPEKEIALMNFLHTAFKTGPAFIDMLAHHEVSPLLKAEKHLLGERHLLTGFIRFVEDEGTLVSTISPKNYILPFISGHFAERFHNERFIIYDKTHKAGLFHKDGELQIIPLSDVEFGRVSEKEAMLQALWRRFYDTIAIQSRINPKCRMSHMPKRYWENMTELSDEV